MNDLISRQAAIDAVSKGCQEWRGIFERCEKNLKELPFVRAFELPCDGCKFVGTKDTEFPCSMCIRREKDYYEQER